MTLIRLDLLLVSLMSVAGTKVSVPCPDPVEKNLGAEDLLDKPYVDVNGNCEGSYFQLELLRSESQLQPKDQYALIIYHNSDGRILYDGSNDWSVKQSLALATDSNVFRVTANSSTGQLPVRLLCKEVPYNVSLVAISGSDGLIETSLAGNGYQRFDFAAGHWTVDLNWQLAQRTSASGIVAVTNGPDRMYVMSSPSGSLKVSVEPSSFGRNFSVHFRTFNVPSSAPLSRLQISYNSIVQTTTTSTSVAPTSSTVAPLPSDKTVEIFVLLVDEETFVKQHLGPMWSDIQKAVSGWPDCRISLAAPIQCRRRCHLSSASGRGCVALTVTIGKSSLCTLSAEELKGSLNKLVEQWVLSFQAARIEFDQCLHHAVVDVLLVTALFPAVTLVLIGVMGGFWLIRTQCHHGRWRNTNRKKSGNGPTRRKSSSLKHPVIRTEMFETVSG